MKKIIMPTAMALFLGFVADSQAQQPAVGSGATTSRQASGTNSLGKATNNSYNTSGQAGTTQGMGSRMDKKSMERNRQPSQNGTVNSRSNGNATTTTTKKTTRSSSTTN